MTTVEQLETVDITKLNAIAAGTNKKVPRVVAAGLGGKLMGTSDLVKVTAEEITKDSMESLAERMPEKGKICQQETHFRRAMDFRQFCQKNQLA